MRKYEKENDFYYLSTAIFAPLLPHSADYYKHGQNALTYSLLIFLQVR
jgi:hypothetical protein